MGHSTIKSYLAAVRSLQIDYGFQNPFGASMPKLERMNGIKDSKKGRPSHPEEAAHKNSSAASSMERYWLQIRQIYALGSGYGMFLQIYESRGADDVGQG